MLSEKSQAIVIEHERGATVTELAERFGVSHQRVSAILVNATAFVNRVELDLMVARKTDERCAYVIPFSPYYHLGMAYSDWLIRKLRARGLTLAISTQRASNGLALILADTTDYGSDR